jgi:hypothetical protein
LPAPASTLLPNAALPAAADPARRVHYPDRDALQPPNLLERKPQTDDHSLGHTKRSSNVVRPTCRPHSSGARTGFYENSVTRAAQATSQLLHFAASEQHQTTTRIAHLSFVDVAMRTRTSQEK